VITTNRIKQYVLDKDNVELTENESLNVLQLMYEIKLNAYIPHRTSPNGYSEIKLTDCDNGILYVHATHGEGDESKTDPAIGIDYKTGHLSGFF
jgi:hypothetical protein